MERKSLCINECDDMTLDEVQIGDDMTLADR